MSRPAPASRAAADPSERASQVRRAVNDWVDQLTDLSRNNNLLYYRDLRHGTLDLAEANDAPLRRLFAGERVRCSQLFPDQARRSDAKVRLRTIHRKMRELDEQYGINTVYLAAGLVSWGGDRRSPAAPVLLHGLSVKPTSTARDDFELMLGEEPVVNQALLRKLQVDFGVCLSKADLDDLVKESPLDLTPGYKRLLDLAPDVPGLTVENRLVVGTFSYARLPMVEDLQSAGELLVANDVAAALAGVNDALSSVAQTWADGTGETRDFQVTTPADEFFILDADQSQARSINAVLAGRNLVVEGPPGTGKSQTIANMIAALIAADKRVLFVAEKRAAIDAVLRYLTERDLADLVLDVHDSDRTTRAIAGELSAALSATEHAVPPLRDLHRRLHSRRKRLDDHAAAMNEVREPWGFSLFEAQARLAGIPSSQRSAVRVRDSALAALAGEHADQARDDLMRLAEIRSQVRGPWAGASLPDRQTTQRASELAQRLSRQLLPTALRQLAVIRTQLHLNEPSTYTGWRALYQFLEGVAGSCRLLGDDIFQADLGALTSATASRTQRRAEGRPPLKWFAGVALRRRAHNRWRGDRPTRSQLYEALASAERCAEIWRKNGFSDVPALPSNWSAAAPQFALLDGCIRTLDAVLTVTQLAPAGLADLRTTADQLAADTEGPLREVMLAELHRKLVSTGLAELVAEVCVSDADADQSAALLDSAYYSSIVDYVRKTDPRCAELGGPGLSRAVADFWRHDREHLARNAERVKLHAVRRAREVRTEYPRQASLLSKEAGKPRRHLPLRDLIDQAPDVLLSLKPCLATSPLLVSRVLPQRQLFDVVIFDEASQVTQADAMPSIIRAKQAVVAGDTQQLPPSDFFRSLAGDDDDSLTADETSPLSRTGAEFDSILDALRTVLPQARLTWHYRSRDERLVAFSNKHFYDSSLITFPGIGSGECLEHVVAEQEAGIAGQEESVAAEVDRVVELILEHATTREAESLGVITLGIKHMERIQAKLRQAQAGRDDLTCFFNREKRDFFIKNLERVQGDERDAIILTVGYGRRRADGRVQQSWGPLTTEGGERRLNVAVTRARNRLTVVTSFRTEETDPSSLTHQGGKLLCDYLRYVDSGGRDLQSPLRQNPELNPFERDVMRRLEMAGIPVIPQYGAGKLRIDFAATHPRVPGRMVLAIEADGASYHSAGGARDRDRLRQETLERLGWKFHRIWSTDWFTDPDSEIAKIRAAYDRAIGG